MSENVEQVMDSPVQDGKLHVGTLSYTKRGLVMLFVYLLWGDFCFTLMEQVFPQVTPLTMGKLGASGVLVGLVMTTIPNIFNAIVCPWVSFKSDRHRGKLGRRMPFLLYPTPFIALFLVLIGFSPELGKFLFHTVLKTTHWSATAITLTLIAIFAAGFQFFNMFVGSVYYYLFNDVVPAHYLSRFMSAFRLVGVIAGAAFNAFVLRYAESHMKWIFIGGGLLYLIAFMQMCFKVKEGDYPPPPEYTDGKTGIISGIKTYGRECFFHKFYWYFFVGTAFADLIAVAYPFILLMQRQALGLTTGQIGNIAACGLVVTAILILPAGWLADKKHPLQIQIWATAVLFLLTPARVIYLFHHYTPAEAYRTEFILQMILIPAQAIYVVSNLPMFMRILPSERFGQFCSAQAMFRSVAGILCGLIVGGSLDLIKKVCISQGLGATYNLRYAFVWQTLCWGLSLLLLTRLYKLWVEYGGEKSFVPPGFASPAADAPAAALETDIDSATA